ncbi:SusC/RagA family TonB-linked outer membrane protein [Pontibacter sp. KCTC 32443]|uniref:SusC/RagA family TonB-linked outer membrane protein n=1 Tax=Pontibacter TaxID=323449 RepID=UPI00164E76F6|nr:MULTISPECIES: SusC/RagA family TonB-linked outer membrane protein [Pontibacter]MBC5775979.1 SusC/RagA family TonB-linked outer membrane protein [Pontibacter sp. KCTC 32443]
MKKLLMLTFLLVSALLQQAMAQSRTITGKVTDASTNQPLPGVTVLVKGTTVGTASTVDGSYTINVPEGGNTLVFRYIGYVTTERAISGNTVNVALPVDAKQLGEVVVTALGIERQKKEIGYATTTVTNEVVTRANPVNIANGLQGKVAGLNISTVNNGVFENVKINLRGIRSLTGNNNPLLVIDGIPADLNYLSSLNPNDIESTNILKGASAAAIYGPDARNGVIIVTTKKGSGDDKPVITLSHSTQLQQISFFPKFQTKFGSGGYGEYVPYENWSWGPAFDGSEVEIGQPLEDGSVQKVKYSPTNEREDFFNTGVVTQNDISFASKNFYISLQDANIKGIVPHDENRRTGIRLNTSNEYGKFKVGFNTNYIQQNYNIFDDNSMADYHAAQNVGLNQGLMNLIFNTPAQIPITSYKDFKNNKWAQYNNYFNDYGLNPYFAIDNWRLDGKREDLLTNADFNFKATDWLNISYRAGLTSRTITERESSKGEIPTVFGVEKRGFSPIPGTVQERSYKSTRLSSELFANLSKEINENFKVTGVVGTYVRQTDARDTRVGATSLVVPELFNIDNLVGQLDGSSPFARTRLFSIYGSAGLSYKGWANVEVTGRNDRTSVLAMDNNSFFYPGVSGSLVLSDAIGALQNNNIVSYVKLRGSWSKTGNADISPYLLAATFSQASGFPYGTLPGFTANNTKYDAALEPEFIESKEVGIETGFLDGRINIDATYYHQNNDNQIIPINVSSATGYTSAFVNAASFINRGAELDLRITPLVELGDVNIEFRGNVSYNDNEVTSVYQGLDEIAQGGYTTAANYIVNGQPAFVIKASDYARDPQGRVIVDRFTGYPVADPSVKQFGRTLPKWILGLNPSVSWKGLNLSVLGEYKGGHIAYHNIGSAMAWTGVSAQSGRNNRDRFVYPNSVYEDPANEGQYIENTDIAISNTNDFYTGVFRSTNSNFITSAAHWRLREVALSYELPTSLVSRQNVVKGITVSLTGRNLALWLPETNEFQDPDFSFTTEGNTAGITNSNINPPTRTFGGNVTLRF